MTAAPISAQPGTQGPLFRYSPMDRGAEQFAGLMDNTDIPARYPFPDRIVSILFAWVALFSYRNQTHTC